MALELRESKRDEGDVSRLSQAIFGSVPPVVKIYTLLYLPLLEFGLTKYDFSPKSPVFVFFQPKFQEGVAHFSSYLRHGGMTIEFSIAGIDTNLDLLKLEKIVNIGHKAVDYEAKLLHSLL